MNHMLPGSVLHDKLKEAGALASGCDGARDSCDGSLLRTCKQYLSAYSMFTPLSQTDFCLKAMEI